MEPRVETAYLLDFYGTYARSFNDKHDLSVMAGYGWQHI